MKVVLCALNSQYIHSNPALFSLARALEGLPEPPQLVLRQYALSLPYPAIMRELYDDSPDILAFSTYIWNIGQVERLLGDLGRLLPQTLLLLGGPEATARAAELLASSEHLHGVLLGEGEELFPRLISALQRGEQRPELPGLLWRGQDSAAPCAAPPPDLAKLPFLYREQDLATLSQARQVIYYESSRGCPYSCAFCASATEPLRERPLPLVLQELPLLAQAGGQIKFVDRTFNAEPTRAAAISEAILQLYRPGLSWHFEISPYSLPPRLIELWQTAPPHYLRLEAGIQSLHSPALAAIKRGGSWPAARQALLGLLKRDNLRLHLDLIAGLPQETLSTFAAAFDQLHALSPHYLQLGFLKILPGSPLAAEAKGLGLLYSAYPPYQVLQTPTISAIELLELQSAAKALNSYYNSGRFRQTMRQAAQIWPGGALALYQRLAWEQEKRGPGGLNAAAQAELLATLLLPLNEPLFLDLLRLDWLSYQDNQPLPPALRREGDKPGAFLFAQGWSFDEAGLAEALPGPALLRFDWKQRLGVSKRAAALSVSR